MAAQHILVVDDDAGFAEATGAVLREAGFRVTTASHFSSALTVLEGNDPVHLLLLDIAMPGSVNGVALSEWGACVAPICGSSISRATKFLALRTRHWARFFASQSTTIR